jgi:hypothetical protein
VCINERWDIFVSDVAVTTDVLLSLLTDELAPFPMGYDISLNSAW